MNSSRAARLARGAAGLPVAISLSVGTVLNSVWFSPSPGTFPSV
ncbi:hypothetical protein J2T09_001918 [Neorhizobium huautlense]|uniref:Uncharacterized protein n=1 Tax=Neorhizobium huautlense TaxID=67774 RepID=A0ABT9PRS1_9HYPH|nr:hypothetical protein [Neorhizobium huautlense]MDP9837166.1 hypothetical protein [Neorhizobium huautlense]